MKHSICDVMCMVLKFGSKLCNTRELTELKFDVFTPVLKLRAPASDTRVSL
jgi:hypothetical protein